MKRFTITLILIPILVSVLACGVMPLPRTTPAVFDYHRILTPWQPVTVEPTPTAQALPEAGAKGREWTP